MTGRLPTGTLVGALLRRVNDAGGLGMVRARGDAQSGGILLLLSVEGGLPQLRERRLGLDGRDSLIPAGGESLNSHEAVDDYWQRRRDSDPDLWVVELDIARAEQFAAETILAD